MQIKELLQFKKFEDIDEFTFWSPAGDDMGSDNACINFGYDNPKDILEAVEEIKTLLDFADFYEDD